MSNDELREGDKMSSLGLTLSLDLDEAILRAQDEIARLNLALFEKKAANKELTEQVEQKQAECKFRETELKIAEMKTKFKD